MSKNTRSSLLSKNQVQKHVEQEEWVELQSVRNNKFSKNKNSTSYKKLEQEESQYSVDDRSEKSQRTESKGMNANKSSISPEYPQYAPNMQNPSSRVYQTQYSNSRVQPPVNRQSYIKPNNGQNNYRQSQLNENQPRQSQFQQNPRNSQIRQSQVRSSIRSTIPEMTVNCQKCTFAQSIPGNSQLYVCCMCNQINQSYPLYGVFVCGVCYSNVIYPYGTSQFMKCSKCTTINRVPFQPKKQYKSMMKKPKANQQNTNQSNVYESNIPQSNPRSQYQQSNVPPTYKQPQINPKLVESRQPSLPSQRPSQNSQKPFKMIPKPLLKQQNVQFQILDESNPNRLKREEQMVKNTFESQLMDIHQQFNQNIQSQNPNLHRQILEMTEKLDDMSMELHQLVKDKKVARQEQKVQISNEKIQYPSIFD